LLARRHPHWLVAWAVACRLHLKTLHRNKQPTNNFMPNFSWTPACVAALWLLTVCGAGAQQAGTPNLERVEVVGRKAAVARWFRAESRHFIVYSDAREEDATLLLDNLEKLDHLLRTYTQPVRQAEVQGPKLTLYYLNSPSQLQVVDAAAPADAVGFYSSCQSGAQGFAVQLERVPSLSDDRLDKAPLNDTLSHAFEAYARYFLYRRTDIRVPPWFVAGFAQYFSSVRFSGQQMVVGRAPKVVTDYLRFIDGGKRYSLEYEDVLQHRLADGRNYAGADGVQLEFEAKSWLLTHYLMSSEDRRKRLSRYLALVDAGAAPAAAFESSFDVKVADVSELTWRYGLKGLETLRVALPALPAAQVKFRTLPQVADEILLVDAALKSCPGPQAGQALLKQAAALVARFPNDRLARLAVSRAQIDWGDAQHAVSRLRALLQEDDTDFDAHYLLGMANLRLAQASEGASRRSVLQEAQRHLRRAQGLKPGAPEVALAAFKVELASAAAPDDAALQEVISAWQTARDINALTRSAALAHAFAGNADEALRALASLSQDLRDPSMARWASQWRGRLETGVTRRDILAEMRREETAAPFKDWTTDKEGVMQKVQLSAGLESAEALVKQRDASQQAMPPLKDFDGGMKRK
jgi:hypothetical protein